MGQRLRHHDHHHRYGGVPGTAGPAARTATRRRA